MIPITWDSEPTRRGGADDLWNDAARQSFRFEGLARSRPVDPARLFAPSSDRSITRERAFSGHDTTRSQMEAGERGTDVRRNGAERARRQRGLMDARRRLCSTTIWTRVPGAGLRLRGRRWRRPFTRWAASARQDPQRPAARCWALAIRLGGGCASCTTAGHGTQFALGDKRWRRALRLARWRWHRRDGGKLARRL